MSSKDSVNILLVDDQPAKLMSLEAILADMGENIIKVESADEALKLLLSRDIAVVLVDVCMPRMDGFELAELIRGHPRFKRTAIIFISAVHLTDADRLKGYGLGAVDYIPVPIIPDVLRAKVAVFADLYRKTEQLQRLNHELERRVAERTADLEASTERLTLSEQRHRQLVHALPAAVYTCDAEGRIQVYNQAAVALWGREPCLDEDLWCGSHRIFRPDGSPLPMDECPMATSIREGRSVRGEEVVIERPDGTRRHVVPHPEPTLDASGKVVGAVNMLVDVTEQKRAERALRESESRFRMMADSAPTLVWLAGTDKLCTWFNKPWLEFTGRAMVQELGNGWTESIHPEDLPRCLEVYTSAFDARREFRMEYRLRRHDGEYRWLLDHGIPLHSGGEFTGYIGSCIDVTDLVLARHSMERQQALLEDAVRARTDELAKSSERLRLSERMATIGTLAAGLGHDMGNLLLPVRMRLDTIEAADLHPQIREDVAAIREASEYLQRLAGSLRLLALDPRSDAGQEGSTDLAAWWSEVEGMIRNGIARPTKLRAEFEGGLPPVRLGKAALTQMVFNLAQNAGDALRGRDDGRVTIRARAGSAGRMLEISVSDNGPGMSDETRRRCLEPFFTTKTRGVSTGLGLTLVTGLVQRADGTMHVESSPGTGSTFRLELPAALPHEGEGDAPRRRGVAVVSLRDKHAQAHVRSLLSSLEFEVKAGSEPASADVWITDGDGEDTPDAVRRFLTSRPDARAFLLGGVERPLEADSSLVVLEPDLKPSQLRARLKAALDAWARDPEHEPA